MLGGKASYLSVTKTGKGGYTDIPTQHKGWVVQELDCQMLDFFLQAEDGIRAYKVTGVQTCALPICWPTPPTNPAGPRCSCSPFRSTAASGRSRPPADSIRGGAATATNCSSSAPISA